VTIYKLGASAPTIHESVFVADSANIIGNVTLEENSSVWFGATLRGDNEPIRKTRCCTPTRASP
jgi:carbonic anhydrase/acetyltransferase-like protein (isoleucine patch superfamily)